MNWKVFLRLPYDRGWDDGREGFEYPRFDAVVGKIGGRVLRAEVTWSMPKPPELNVIEPWVMLEVCSDVDGLPQLSEFVLRELLVREVKAIIASPPSKLIEQFKDEWDSLLYGLTL